MTKFIELTTLDDDDLLINVEAIHYIYPTVSGEGTIICFGDNTFQVKETYNCVKNKVGRATWIGMTDGILEKR